MLACKAAWYFSDDCKLAHEEDCSNIVELMLFQVPPLREECPIRTLLLPYLDSQSIFYTCCGELGKLSAEAAQMLFHKRTCGMAEVVQRLASALSVDHCSLSISNDDESVRRLNNLVQEGNLSASALLGIHYSFGEEGYRKDLAKSITWVF
jgi:hypothetical protein